MWYKIVLLTVFILSSGILYSQNQANKYLKYAKICRTQSHPDSTSNSAIPLDDTWEEFSVSEGNLKPVKPILKELPTAVLEQPTSGWTLRISEVLDTIPATWSKLSTDNVIHIDVGDKSNITTIQFGFYGIGQMVSIPKEYGSFHPKGISEKDVNEFWQQLSAFNYNIILSDCYKYKVALGYNDWAILKWVQALAEAIYPTNVYSEREIFTVFILNQLELQVRLARVDDKLVTLFSSLQNVYARKYIVINTYPYYLDEDIPLASQVYTYISEYSKPLRPLDLRILTPLRLSDGSNDLLITRFSSVWEQNINLSVSNSLVKFFNKYPQLDAKVYASAAPTEGLLNIFKTMMSKSMDQDHITTINNLLCFMHLDFKYKVDQEQFGKEKPFFFEENFIYPYNDCEDRSILLSSLIQNLLNLKVVLLDYEDHMAVAVNLPETIKGDHLILNNEKYYICDPTYIGATIGMSIPKYKRKAVKVHLL